MQKLFHHSPITNPTELPSVAICSTWMLVKFVPSLHYRLVLCIGELILVLATSLYLNVPEIFDPDMKLVRASVFLVPFLQVLVFRLLQLHITEMKTFMLTFWPGESDVHKPPKIFLITDTITVPSFVEAARIPWIWYAYVRSDAMLLAEVLNGEVGKQFVTKIDNFTWPFTFLVAVFSVPVISTMAVVFCGTHFRRTFAWEFRCGKTGVLYSYIEYLFWPAIPIKTEFMTYLYVWILKMIVIILTARPVLSELISGWMAHQNLIVFAENLFFTTILKASCESVVIFYGFAFFIAGSAGAAVYLWNSISSLLLEVRPSAAILPYPEVYELTFLLQTFIVDLHLDSLTSVQSLATQPQKSRDLAEITVVMMTFCFLRLVHIVPNQAHGFYGRCVAQDLPLPNFKITVVAAGFLPFFLACFLCFSLRDWTTGHLSSLLPHAFVIWILAELYISMVHLMASVLLSGVLLPVLYHLHLEVFKDDPRIRKNSHRMLFWLIGFEEFVDLICECGIIGAGVELIALWHLTNKTHSSKSTLLEIYLHGYLLYLYAYNAFAVWRKRKEEKRLICYSKCVQHSIDTTKVTGADGVPRFECMLCGSTENDEELGTLPCKHVFHKRCLALWFQRASHCPYCHSEVNLQ